MELPHEAVRFAGSTPRPPRDAARTVGPTRAAFWKAFWITMRPYLAFVSGGAALVGMASLEHPSVARVACALPPLFVAYGLGQVLTDCFQTDTDSLSSPYRPLVRGVVSAGALFAAACAGLVASAAVLALLDGRTVALAGLAVAGLLTYTPMKRRWWAGPPWNSAIVALLPFIGWYGVGAQAAAAPPATLLVAAGALFLAYADFVITGSFKDISADRAAGYRTLVVVFGWRRAAWWAHAHAAGAWALVALAVAAGRPSTPAWLALLAGGLVAARGHLFLHSLREEHDAHAAIADVVRAFVLYATALALAQKPGWTVALGGSYAAFEWAIRTRPERTQV